MPHNSHNLDPHLNDQLLNALERVYKDEGKLSDWTEESQIYVHALPKLIKDLEEYDIVQPLKLGSTAIVWKLKERKLGQLRALKLPRPRLGRLNNIVRAFRGERDKLAALNHENVVKIYTAGELEFSVAEGEYSFPYFVMEFLPAVRDLSDFIAASALQCGALNLIDYFRHILTGLGYLHREGIIHCDIKPANILIAPGRPALISDFGYAKHFQRPTTSGKDTDLTFTRDYGHPELRRRIKDETDKNATIAVIPKEDLRREFDLYALGKTFLEMVRTHVRKRDEVGDHGP